MHLRLLYPDQFKVAGGGTTHHEIYRRCCALSRYACFQYHDMTEQSDIDKVCGDEDSCPHHVYEKCRLQ